MTDGAAFNNVAPATAAPPATPSFTKLRRDVRLEVSRSSMSKPLLGHWRRSRSQSHSELWDPTHRPDAATGLRDPTQRPDPEARWRLRHSAQFVLAGVPTALNLSRRGRIFGETGRRASCIRRRSRSLLG